MNRYLICCNGVTEWHTCTKEAICLLAKRIANAYNNIVEVESFNGIGVKYMQFYPELW